MKCFYTELIDKFCKIVKQNNFSGDQVNISGKVLSSSEALGNPGRNDFPLLTGKECLMEADFREHKGQAYTDMPGNFSGNISDILKKIPENNYERAVLVSSINAVSRFLNMAEKTVHCKNDEPELCAAKLVDFVRNEHGNVQIALIGYQPSMLERLAKNFPVRNLDLDYDKIGAVKFGVEVENGNEKIEEVLEWCDVVLATGSTLVNGTIESYRTSKPVYFYGTTISGTAQLMGLKRFCSHAG